MTLPDPALLFDSLDCNQPGTSSRKNELLHVSEILTESGIPVADSLKERMLEELAALIEDEGSSEHECLPRRSA